VVNSLGELASRTADGGQACDHHAQALAIARDFGIPRRKHAPWKASAAAIFATATPAKPLPAWNRHLPSTSASQPPPPAASRKPSSNSGKAIWPQAWIGKPPDPSAYSKLPSQ
jgi:hypothetical protein